MKILIKCRLRPGIRPAAMKSLIPGETPHPFTVREPAR